MRRIALLYFGCPLAAAGHVKAKLGMELCVFKLWYLYMLPSTQGNRLNNWCHILMSSSDRLVTFEILLRHKCKRQESNK